MSSVWEERSGFSLCHCSMVVLCSRSSLLGVEISREMIPRKKDLLSRKRRPHKDDQNRRVRRRRRQDIFRLPAVHRPG